RRFSCGWRSDRFRRRFSRPQSVMRPFWPFPRAAVGRCSGGARPPVPGTGAAGQYRCGGSSGWASGGGGASTGAAEGGGAENAGPEGGRKDGEGPVRVPWVGPRGGGGGSFSSS